MSVLIVIISSSVLLASSAEVVPFYRTAELYTMVNENLDVISQKAADCGCPASAININPPETVEDGDHVIAGIFHHSAEDMYQSYQEMLKECECIHHEAGATKTLLHIYRFEKPSFKLSQIEVERDFASIIDAMTDSVEQCCLTKESDRENER